MIDKESLVKNLELQAMASKALISSFKKSKNAEISEAVERGIKRTLEGLINQIHDGDFDVKE